MKNIQLKNKYFKNNIFKNIFYIFFALCFLSAGFCFLKLPKTQNFAAALDVTSEDVENENLPDYFLAQEFVSVGENISQSTDSLISQNTFLHFSEGSSENFLKISLANSKVDEETNGILDHVFYPNANDKSTFHFYNIFNLALTINGELQDLGITENPTTEEERFIHTTNYSFENFSSAVKLQDFSMIFNRTGSGANEFSILDTNNQVKEGLYSLSMKVVLFTCTDGDGAQETFLPEREIPITFNFYVLSRDNYLINNRPVIKMGAFDNVVEGASTAQNAYVLYSNHTAKNAEDEIPYIQFDYRRFELSVRKELNGEITYSTLQFDKDSLTSANTSPVVVDGANMFLTEVDKTTNTCKVYFNDMGVYTVSFNAIKLASIGGKTHKFALGALSERTRDVAVHMFGFQVGYTDFDQDLQENNSRPTGELKKFEKDSTGKLTGKYADGADITSKFVNSNEGYSQENYNTTFIRSNIVNFLNKDKDGKVVSQADPTSALKAEYAQKPVQTNQTPIRFTSNATLLAGTSATSYVLTTNENMPGYVETSSLSLQGKKLWQKEFTGQSENTAGTYIYLIAYRYNDFTNSQKVFYQVFFFEIVKGTPSISVTYQKDGKTETVFSNTFVNQFVTVNDTTKADAFNKDVTVQIYAFDYRQATNGQYMTQFGGENGIAYSELLENGTINGAYEISEDGKVILKANAKYTIRLYYTSDLKDKNLGISTNINSSNGSISEQFFTIDQVEISNVRGRNVTETTSGFQLLNDMSAFTTNQKLSIAWDKKQSGAKSFAYYRFFPLVGEKYYSEDSANVSRLLSDLQAQDNFVIPVNSVLDLDAQNKWIPLGGTTGGNSESFESGKVLPSEYVLSDAGLYLVDIQDEAGNRKLEVFLIDNTTPLFVLSDGEYSLTSPITYINKTSTLYWGDFKGIYIHGLNNEIFRNNNIGNPPTWENVKEGKNVFKDRLFKDEGQQYSTEIYNLIYEKLFSQSAQHMQMLNCQNVTVAADVSNLIASYTGLYLTIKINDLSFFSTDENSTYQAQTKAETNNRHTIVVGDQELTYRIVIRDLSNTKLDLNSVDENGSVNEDSRIQYTNHYSARQTIKVSFDDSKFKIADDILPASYEETGTVTVGGVVRNTKTTYLAPTNLKQALTVSFLPTTTDESGSTKIQVESVVVQYQRFKSESKTVGTQTFWYKTLSDDVEEYAIYTRTENGESSNLFSHNLGISNTEQITNPGKYVITRTYRVDNGFEYDTKDFYQRTFVLIVDRHEVITNPETVDDGHAESLVGGDVFVTMFDNKTNSSFVVSCPNSDMSNTDGKSIYDNKLLMTTNKLPVNIYIPQFKYTTYAQKVENPNGSYDFKVNYNFEEEAIENDGQLEIVPKDTLNNFNENLKIKEYTLFARLYKNEISSSNLIGATVKQNFSDPSIEDVSTDGNGFLVFHRPNGEVLGSLTETGTYFVQLFQGWFGEGFEVTPFTFSFEIKSATPDFSARLENGQSLGMVPNSNVTTANPYTQTYFTNNSEICLTWEASTDDYMVQIDANAIELVTKNGTVYSTNPDSRNYAPDIWTIEPYEQDNHTYLAKLNLERLSGVYQNDGWVDIKMQFENQDEAQSIYKPVTKRIYIDLSAPNENIINLVNSSISSDIAPLDKNRIESTLRVKQTAKLQTADGDFNTSFNTSNPDPESPFAYYSYVVSKAFLQQLKNSKEYETYVRLFEDELGNNTKYSQDSKVIQETSTSASLTNGDFTEIKNMSAFEAGKYYEIVETDRAGNRTIYTIFVQDDETQDLPLISYVDGQSGQEKAYTLENFKLAQAQTGAINNIYSRTGFRLSGINAFGDEWAQIKLVTRTARGDTSTQTLMLSPHTPGYALSFVGNATPTPIAISSLIDGNVSMEYKHNISINSRLTATQNNFYVNIRNTSLSASLTDQQDEEYIRFRKVSDSEIQNTERASTYLTQLSITAHTAGGSILIYGTTETGLTGEGKNPLGYAADWKSNSSVLVQNDNNLTFRVRPELSFIANARIVYHFVDNYGRQYNEIHIYHETMIPQELSSSSDLYSFTNEAGTKFYITDGNFQFTYNPNKYDVKALSLVGGEKDTLIDADERTTQNSNGTNTLTISSKFENSYDQSFVLEVRDHNNANIETNLIKEVYFRLYNTLPAADEDNGTGRFWLLDANGANITNKIVGAPSSDDVGYFSEVRIMYTQKDSFIPVKYSISKNLIDWTEVASGTRIRSQSDTMERYFLKVWYDETFLVNENGNFAYVFGNVPRTQIFEMNLSSLTATYWVEKTENGITTIVEKTKNPFVTSSGRQYANHYLVNLDYSHKSAVEIKLNKEQEIDKELEETFTEGNVVSELWRISNRATSSASGIPAYETRIVISYVPFSENFVEEFYASNVNGILENDNLIAKTSASVVVPQEYSGADRVQIQWSKFYGLVQNEIELKLFKDGVKLKPEIYTKRSGDKQYSYTYLTYSGKYTIQLCDVAGNIQKFNLGSSGQTDTFTFIFLKDVPFTVTHTEVDGTIKTSFPIKQAIYNGAVTLNIDPATRQDFYIMGGYPTISVKKNGVEYDGDFATNATSFTFEEPGYYEVMFSATSNKTDVGLIRQEAYQFTILNPAEHKISYVQNQYSNYYVEKVLKDGQDITQALVEAADDSQTIVVDGVKYLSGLSLSYLDEKTGVGTYTITVNSNNALLKKSDVDTSWTYNVTINRGTAPLQVSLAEGKSTTKAVQVSFNQANIFAEMGQSTLRILRQNENNLSVVSSVEIDAQSVGEGSLTISNEGTYFIQIVSPSGTLLFSYKVIKKAPMNAASIIAIVISAIVLIAVIAIVIKLRKRITVK